jgi:hypothetical protein
MHEFRRLGAEIELSRILGQLAALPRLDLAAGPEVEAELPVVVGGLGVALARALQVIDP